MGRASPARPDGSHDHGAAPTRHQRSMTTASVACLRPSPELGRVMGGSVTVDASSSSQRSSPLFCWRGGTLRHRHRHPPFRGADPEPSHIDMTVRDAAAARRHPLVDITDRTQARWTIPPTPDPCLGRTVEPDLSNAAPFLALATVTGGTVVIRDWPADSLQPVGPLIEGCSRRSAPASPPARRDDRDRQRPGARSQRGIFAIWANWFPRSPPWRLADSPSHLSGIGHIRVTRPIGSKRWSPRSTRSAVRRRQSPTA